MSEKISAASLQHTATELQLGHGSAQHVKQNIHVFKEKLPAIIRRTTCDENDSKETQNDDTETFLINVRRCCFRSTVDVCRWETEKESELWRRESGQNRTCWRSKHLESHLVLIQSREHRELCNLWD